MKKLLILMFTMQLIFIQQVNAQICNMRPSVNTTSYTITCNTNANSFNTLITNIPQGATLFWSISKTLGLPFVHFPNTTGTYYAYFFDDVNQCYSLASEPIVFTNVCNCSQAANDPNNRVVNSNLTNVTYQNEIIHVTNSITLFGNCSFNQVRFYIEPGVTITVDNNAVVNCRFIHMTCCDGMWQGINVKQGGRFLMSYDLDWLNVIEDAVVGLNYNFSPPYFPNLPNTVLRAVHTVFNRCETGIRISNLYGNSAGGDFMPFIIEGCTFTSRELPILYSNLPYTFSHAFISPITNLWWTGASILPNTLTAPFINHPSFPAPDNTSKSFLKNNVSKSKPKYGIQLLNCSESDQIFFIGGNNTSNSINIFDNLDIGIDARSAKLQLNSCVFQKSPVNVANAPNGIGVNCTFAKVSGNSVTLNNTNPINNTTAQISNAFYELKNAIRTNNFENVTVDNCEIRSNQNKNLFTSIANNNITGLQGIVVQGNNISDINIINNNIVNIATGIVFTDSRVQRTNNQSMDINIDISNNKITRELPNATPTNKEFIAKGISLNGTNKTLKTDFSSLICNNNTIDNAYGGLDIINFLGKSLSVELNTIKLALQPVGAAKIEPQFGISISNCIAAVNSQKIAIANSISNNLVTSSFVGGDVPINSKQTNIYATNCQFLNVQCNKVENGTHGIRFLGLNNNTRFFDNTIEPTNLYGYTLDQGGQIGPQGSTGLRGNCNSDNNWKQSATFWKTNYGGIPHFMTYVNSAIAKNSPLYVANFGGSLNPHGASKSNAQGVKPYSHFANIDQSIFPQAASTVGNGACRHCQHSQSTPNTENIPLNREEVQTLEEIATGDLEIIDDDPESRLFVLQQQLYDYLVANGNAYLNNTTLQDFVNNTNITSFDYIHYIQYYLDQGDMATVNNLLGIMPTNNIIEQNYNTYYGWMAAMADSPSIAPNIDDVFAMASLCPAKNGAVVYKARALYRELTDDFNYVFEDECPESITGRKKPKALATLAEEKYIAAPNPVMDICYINNKNITHYQLFNAMGKLIKQQKCDGFGVETIDMSQLQKGFYLLVMFKVDRSKITNKLIKQ